MERSGGDGIGWMLCGCGLGLDCLREKKGFDGAQRFVRYVMDGWIMERRRGKAGAKGGPRGGLFSDRSTMKKRVNNKVKKQEVISLLCRDRELT